MNEPFVSIIVPVYNAEKIIRKCIESLLTVNYPNYEIIIIDDDSTDDSKSILCEYKDKIHIIESKHFGPSKCRNIAVLESKGDFVAFTDADCIVDKNWLKELSLGFTDEKVVAVGGIQYSPEDETNFGKRVQKFFELTGFLGGYIKSRSKKEISQVPHNPSCNVMYRKNNFLEIGGFDENLWPSEDVDLDYRLNKKGFSFMYNPEAIVYHYRPQSLRKLIKMMYRYGVMQGILTKRYGIFRKIQILPLCLLILIVLFIINKNFLWLFLFFYLFVLFKTKNLIDSCYVTFFSICSGLVWNSGFLIGLIKENY